MGREIIAAGILTLSLLVLFLFNFWQPEPAQALGTIPFGGRILWVEYCCNGIDLVVGPPRPGEFMFTRGSILHAYYNIYEVGPWVLGLAAPGGVCQMVYSFPPCLPRPVEGTIIRVGTSGL